MGAGDVLPVKLRRLPGAVIFSAHPKTLSRANGVLLAGLAAAGSVLVVVAAVILLLFALERSHEGSSAETRCMAGSQALALGHHDLSRRSR